MRDLFKEYIIFEITTYSVLNLNKLMSRMYTTYIRFKNLLFIHPRNPFYIAQSICAVKNKCARANCTFLELRATMFSTELDRSEMRAIFFLNGIWKIIEWSTCGFFFQSKSDEEDIFLSICYKQLLKFHIKFQVFKSEKIIVNLC